LQQAAAELVTAAHLVDPDSPRYADLFGGIDVQHPAVLMGVAFAAAAAWRERDRALRTAAHPILLPLVPDASGDLAQALSTAIGRGAILAPDDLTREMLEAVASNDAVLRALANTRFLDGLQGLLLSAGFDDIVFDVADRLAAALAAEPSYSMLGRDLVHVAVALQRSDGPLRARAMDLYERLLDANVYGAEQAAKDAIGR